MAAFDDAKFTKLIFHELIDVFVFSAAPVYFIKQTLSWLSLFIDLFEKEANWLTKLILVQRLIF